ncbi:hypothetical protein WJU16_16515 [Chitinophaga pollutisoli]|uniref:Beta-galactosidase trimerisation domain-containing protein n=1 Tax=Chitinophaga pollutisoli TaxID=3133966 RepID=A0ABZ2YKA2_9BACT
MSHLIARRKFLGNLSLAAAGFLLNRQRAFAAMPPLTDKAALVLPHFPDTYHAFVWRNWSLVPHETLARISGTTKENILASGLAMGLQRPAVVSKLAWERSYITIIRRNWHLLPRTQLMALLGWDEKKLDFTLREDDFLYEKLGSFKPSCAPVQYQSPSAATAKIGEVMQREFPEGMPRVTEPLFHFISELSAPEPDIPDVPSGGFSPRLGYSYFALYGDPLLDASSDPYPDHYLSRLAACGMDSVWIHIVLHKLVPFPWDASQSAGHGKRLHNLRKLVARAAKQGVKIMLYLNEPRTWPSSFFAKHPRLKGADAGEAASLCTSHPEVQAYLRNGVAAITAAVPGLGGFFSITASENRTNCWSHGQGAVCPRCGPRNAPAVIAELNHQYAKGIRKGMEKHGEGVAAPQLIVWDWGWRAGWGEQIIAGLPKEAMLMSVSEWDVQIERGGVKSSIGEYSISATGPGPRARAHWEAARRAGIRTVAKIQAGNTWEIAAVPWIPALRNVAEHAVKLREERVDGLMLGWTLGGYPSPNLAVVALIGSDGKMGVEEALSRVAESRYGVAAGAVVRAWERFSTAFSEFPFGGGLYFSPMQTGPANLLWARETGYHATMVGFPYDDLQRWRGHYPQEAYVKQLRKIADGFADGLEDLKQETKGLGLGAAERKRLEREMEVAETVAVHFRSAANQCAYIAVRGDMGRGEQVAALLTDELRLAKRMLALQRRNSTLGFEASNHYFYVGEDLAEKVLNCRFLLDAMAGRGS